MDKKDNENSQLTDKEFYDMSKHLKECYDKMEKEKNIYKEQNEELKKVIMMTYSLFRLCSNELEDEIIDEFALGHLIELGRNLCSGTIHEYLLN